MEPEQAKVDAPDAAFAAAESAGLAAEYVDALRRVADADSRMAASTAKFGEMLSQFKQLLTSQPPLAPPTTSKAKPKRNSNQPSASRQSDILATILTAGAPLTRPEIVAAMKLKTEGRLGHHLAWMVTAGLLVNVKQLGYWPADRPVPR